MTLYANDGGTWKRPAFHYVKDGGAWKTVKSTYVKDSGTWKLVQTGWEFYFYHMSNLNSGRQDRVGRVLSDGTETWDNDLSDGYTLQGLAADLSGNVYALQFDSGNTRHRLTKWNSSGANVWRASWDNGEPSGLGYHIMGVDEYTGHIYFSADDRNIGKIVKYDSSGTKVDEVSINTTTVSCIVVGHGYIFIGIETLPLKIIRISKDFATVDNAWWESTQSGEYGCRQVDCFDDDNIYISTRVFSSSTDGARLYLIDGSGNTVNYVTLSNAGDAAGLYGCRIDTWGDVVVSRRSSGGYTPLIAKYSRDLNTQRWSNSSTGYDDLWWVEIDGEGAIYIRATDYDTSTTTVTKYDKDGNFVWEGPPTLYTFAAPRLPIKSAGVAVV